MAMIRIMISLLMIFAKKEKMIIIVTTNKNDKNIDDNDHINK